MSVNINFYQRIVLFFWSTIAIDRSWVEPYVMKFDARFQIHQKRSFTIINVQVLVFESNYVVMVWHAEDINCSTKTDHGLN